MTIPRWLGTYLTDADRERIQQAVREAESTTSGEIVPMIVRRSSAIGHVPILLLSLLVAVFYIAGGPSLVRPYFGASYWLYLLEASALLLLTALGSRMPVLQRILTPHADQEVQVDRRAIIEFYESHMHKTMGATGVLILVSLFERRAVVLADKAINEKVPRDTWKKVCDALVCGIKTRNLSEAMVQAIEGCGQIMAPHFPVRPDDVNELRDQLVIKE